MATNTNVTTLSDIRTAFYDKARDASSTGLSTKIDSLLNTALHDMATNPIIQPYWLERRAVLITRGAYTTGTVTITTASSRVAVTGTSTVWTTTDTFGIANARAGGKMKFAGTNEIYEVSAVGGAGSMTLATQYTGDDITDETYTYFEDEYALASDFLGFKDIRMFSPEQNIRLVGAMEFRRGAGRNDVSGKPRAATLIHLAFSGSSTPRPRVVLYPYPDNEYSIPYTYITSNLAVSSAGAEQAAMTADADEPIMPLRFRYGIILCALKEWYRDRKDDSQRSQEAKAEYVDFMTRMAGMTQVGQDKPRFVAPKRNYGGRRGRRRFQTGTEWDELLV